MWTQTYDPLGFWPFSTLVAALPVLVLLGLLASGRANAWQAALAGLFTAAVAATAVFGMPVEIAVASTLYGAVFAVFRVLWLIAAAVFLYDLAVSTGKFAVMRASIASLSDDRRLQAVLVAFCFGAFIEGAAGFGAPVAISAAFMVGLGFRPFQAATLCLIANTAPVAWGALGTPVRTLAQITALDVEALSATAGRILPPVSFLIPFWLVATMSGLGGMLGVAPALAVIGGVFAFTQWTWSNYVGFELVDIISSVASLIAGAVMLKLWKPEQVWRFENDHPGPTAAVFDRGVPTRRQVVQAWAPFVFLTIAVLIWGLPKIDRLGTIAVKDWLDRHTSWKPAMPVLHQSVVKGPEVGGPATPSREKAEKAILELVPVSSTGTAVFLAALASGGFLGVSPLRMARVFCNTLRRLVPAMAAILAMLALGFLTRYSGMDAVLGLAFTRTGPWLYPIFGTFLGWLGVALTGSDTASNVLFGNLQVITAEKLHLDPVLMASANSTGGVMGKMIDAQSIVVAAAATGEHGQEGRLLRAVLVHSIALAGMVGAIVWLYAHVWPAVVVH